jgi:hypothetical protein
MHFQYQGGDSFTSKASNIAKDFRSFYDLLVDIADFTSASKELLQSFPLKMIDFKVKHICFVQCILVKLLLLVEEESQLDHSVPGLAGNVHARAASDGDCGGAGSDRGDVHRRRVSRQPQQSHPHDLLQQVSTYPLLLLHCL